MPITATADDTAEAIKAATKAWFIQSGVALEADLMQKRLLKRYVRKDVEIVIVHTAIIVKMVEEKRIYYSWKF